MHVMLGVMLFITYLLFVLAGWFVFSFYHNLGNRSKSDPCSYELVYLQSHILSFPKVLQIPPESPCISFTVGLPTRDVADTHEADTLGAYRQNLLTAGHNSYVPDFFVWNHLQKCVLHTSGRFTQCKI
jgi:hypothetical protein